jgi:hypothetical protein
MLPGSRRCFTARIFSISAGAVLQLEQVALAFAEAVLGRHRSAEGHRLAGEVAEEIAGMWPKITYRAGTLALNLRGSRPAFRDCAPARPCPGLAFSRSYRSYSVLHFRLRSGSGEFLPMPSCVNSAPFARMGPVWVPGGRSPTRKEPLSPIVTRPEQSDRRPDLREDVSSSEMGIRRRKCLSLGGGLQASPACKVCFVPFVPICSGPRTDWPHHTQHDNPSCSAQHGRWVAGSATAYKPCRIGI